MRNIILDEEFEKSFSKIKDNALKEKIKKQLRKIIENPEIGKPMRYQKKGTRELYISPFRLSYYFEKETIYILSVYHKDIQ